MSREWRMYWNDMGFAATKIMTYTKEIDATDFTANSLVRDAVLRNLEIIGEAAKKIPHEIRLEVPDLDWRRIAAFRDVIAHAYFAIDDDILWNIVTQKIPELVSAMDAARYLTDDERD